MISLVKTLSTSIDKLKRRVVKFLRLGRNDVQTSLEAAPYGVDSNPIKDMIAIYQQTGEKGKTVIVGYINKNQQAAPGEYRLYSTDKDGVEQSFIWLTNDGFIQINGDDDNMVRFSILKAEFDTLRSDLNSHIGNWNAFAAAYVPGGPTPVGLPPTAISSSTSSADIAASKIDKVLTSS